MARVVGEVRRLIDWVDKGIRAGTRPVVNGAGGGMRLALNRGLHHGGGHIEVYILVDGIGTRLGLAINRLARSGPTADKPSAVARQKRLRGLCGERDVGAAAGDGSDDGREAGSLALTSGPKLEDGGREH